MSSTIHDAAASVFARFSEAWARGDPDALAALFAPEASFVNIAAQPARGQQEIATMHADAFRGPLKGTRLHIVAIAAQELTGDISAVLVHWQLMRDAVEPVTTVVITAVMMKRPSGEWMLAAVQNTQKPVITI